MKLTPSQQLALDQIRKATSDGSWISTWKVRGKPRRYSPRGHPLIPSILVLWRLGLIEGRNTWGEPSEPGWPGSVTAVRIVDEEEQ